MPVLVRDSYLPPHHENWYIAKSKHQVPWVQYLLEYPDFHTAIAVRVIYGGHTPAAPAQ